MPNRMEKDFAQTDRHTDEMSVLHQLIVIGEQTADCCEYVASTRPIHYLCILSIKRWYIGLRVFFPLDILNIQP